MEKLIKSLPPPVHWKYYNRNYYLSECGGADWLQRFLTTSGKDTYPIYRKIVTILGPKPHQRVLDIGCGRGEVLALLANARTTAVGLDYSITALEMASEVCHAFYSCGSDQIHLVRGDAISLPFNTASFDSIVLADIVEHLHHWQLRLLYSECWRILRSNGCMVVHTWPNRWHTKYTYPVIARLSRFFGIERPLNHQKPHDRIMHVNEQSPLSLRRGLSSAGFSIKQAWCDHDSPLSWRPKQFVYWLIHKLPGFRLFFADHLWIAIIKKEI